MHHLGEAGASGFCIRESTIGKVEGSLGLGWITELDDCGADGERLPRGEAHGSTYHEMMDTSIDWIANRLVLSMRLVTRHILRNQGSDGSGQVLTQHGRKCIMLGNNWSNQRLPPSWQP